MTIPIVEQGTDCKAFVEMSVLKCEFCGKDTNTLHIETDNPVCGRCSNSHKVSELKNQRNLRK